jgi:hypothetical protein
MFTTVCPDPGSDLKPFCFVVASQTIAERPVRREGGIGHFIYRHVDFAAIFLHARIPYRNQNRVIDAGEGDVYFFIDCLGGKVIV